MARSKHESQAAKEPQEFNEVLISIRRVAKVVKGGRRFNFSALVVCGDGKGRVGFGTGTASEVGTAKDKATQAARKALKSFPLREGRTLHHDVYGRFGSGKVILRAAPPGTGIIAGGPMRAVFEVMGIQDVVAKSIGSSSPHNMVRATFEALGNVRSPRYTASKRGKRVGEILGRREGKGKDANHDESGE